MEMLLRLVNVIARFRSMEIHSTILMAAMGALVVFGLLNCLLGYRLLRFWMMLGGFAIGAVLGYLVAGVAGVTQQNYYLAAAAGCGIVFGILTFFVYRVGIFTIGAAIGLVVSIYVLHPTTSSVFFVCILVGVGLGTLTVKFSREVIVVSTSVLGGVIAAIAVCKLAVLREIPYGILFGLVFAAIGMLVQFATNKVPEAQEVEESPDDPGIGQDEKMEAEK